MASRRGSSQEEVRLPRARVVHGVGDEAGDDGAEEGGRARHAGHERRPARLAAPVAEVVQVLGAQAQRVEAQSDEHQRGCNVQKTR